MNPGALLTKIKPVAVVYALALGKADDPRKPQVLYGNPNQYIALTNALKLSKGVKPSALNSYDARCETSAVISFNRAASRLLRTHPERIREIGQEFVAKLIPGVGLYLI